MGCTAGRSSWFPPDRAALGPAAALATVPWPFLGFLRKVPGSRHRSPAHSSPHQSPASSSWAARGRRQPTHEAASSQFPLKHEMFPEVENHQLKPKGHGPTHTHAWPLQASPGDTHGRQPPTRPWTEGLSPCPVCRLTLAARGPPLVPLPPTRWHDTPSFTLLRFPVPTRS